MPPTPPTNAKIDHDPEALVALFEPLATAGSGWLNVVAELPEGTEVPATPNALAIFSRRGPFIPMATWTAPSTSKRGVRAPSELGIQHGTSKRGVEALAGTPGEVPANWRIYADHPKRGLVVAPPDGTTHLEMATWLLNALKVLCLPPHTGAFLTLAYPG